METIHMNDAFVGSLVIGILTLAGGFWAILKIYNNLKESITEENESYTNSKCALLEQSILHQKEIYSSEIHALTVKLDELRDELRQQNNGIIELLSNTLNRKD